MIRKYHTHTLQTNLNLQHREEEPQNTRSHKTSMKMYEHYLDLTRSGNTIKQQSSGLCTFNFYLLFNRSCTTNGLKLFTFCLCKSCAIIFFVTSCPRYAQWMTRYHLELLYSDEAHPAACAMLGTGAMSIWQTNKPFLRTHVDRNLEQIILMLMFHPD